MSHLNLGLISAYNSLTDKHLTGYFNNTRIRRHLQRVGLITRSGRIVPDKEYRHKLIQRAHQRHVRECLAQAIFHKVLEMERLHQIEIKRKLEEFSRRERVHKIKVERSKRYEEEVIHILSPRPPTGPRGRRTQHSGPEGDNSESSESPGSSRPNTAPGKMQRPVRLKPIHSSSTTASHRRNSPYRRHESSNDTDQPYNYTIDKDSGRRLAMTDFSCGVSPYRLPVINNFVTPVPPPTRRKDRGPKGTPSCTVRGRRLRPTTAPMGCDVNEESPMMRTSVHQSRVSVNMVFYGKTVHLSNDMMDTRDEVKVFQQHCGGENLCVFKGKLREGELFHFVSRRHRGFPFSLTFFLNGLQVERLSSCCEFKHRKGSRLGGRHGHFGFTSVEGASPCYKCIIAMGLDKKPTPPPKRVKEDESTITSPTETNKDTAMTEEDWTGKETEETEVKPDTPPPVEDKARDDYEEDFEADDEGPAEDGAANNERTLSPPGKTKEEDRDERDASDSDEDDKDEDRRSQSASSSSGSDREDSEAEGETKEDQIAEPLEEPQEPEKDTRQVDREETSTPVNEAENVTTEGAGAAEISSPAPPQTTSNDPYTEDSPGDGADPTETEVSDTSVPSGNEAKGDDDTLGAKEEIGDEKSADKCPEEEEPERAKSVQEKLAEAILKDAQCSSEPELSDTSTEEEEECTDKNQQQDNKDIAPEKSVTFTAEEGTQVEEAKCEDNAEGAAEVEEDQGETSGEGHEEEQTVPEVKENDEKVSDLEEKNEEIDEKAALEVDNEETTQDTDKSDEREEAGAPSHPEPEGEIAEEEILEHQVDVPAESTGNEATGVKENGDVEEGPEDTGTKPNEIERDTEETKDGKDNESSPTLEPEDETGETAALGNAEVEEVTANEIAETKAEPLEEPGAVSCDEAVVPDTEKEGDGEATVEGSNTEATAENSSSSSEGSSRDTTVQAENTADTNEVKTKDESTKDEDNKITGVEPDSDRDGHQERVEDDQMSNKGGQDAKNEEEDKVENEKSEEGQALNEELKEEGVQEVSSADEKKTEIDNVGEKASNETEERKRDVEETMAEVVEGDKNVETKVQGPEEENNNNDKVDEVCEEKKNESEKSEKDEESKDEDSKVEASKEEDSKVEDSKDEDSKVEESKGEDSKDEDNKDEDRKDEDSKVEDGKIEDNKDEDSKDEDSKVEESKDEESKVEESKVEDIKDEDSKVEESKDEDNKVEDIKDEDSKVEESKDEDNKVEDSKDEDSKVEDSKVEDNKVEDSKNEDSKDEDNPVEDSTDEGSKVEDSKVEDSKVEDNKVEDSKDEDSKVEDSKDEDNKDGDRKVEDSKVEDSKDEDSKVEESKDKESKEEDSKDEDSKIEDSKDEDSKVEDNKDEDSKDEDSKVEESKVEESKDEDSKVEESKNEDSKVEDSKAEDSKVEDIKSEDSECIQSKASVQQFEQEKVLEADERSQCDKEQPGETVEEEEENKKEMANTSDKNNDTEDNKADVETNVLEDNEAKEISKNMEEDEGKSEKDDRETTGKGIDAENGEKETVVQAQMETQEDEASSTIKNINDTEEENNITSNAMPETITEELNETEHKEGAKEGPAETSDQSKDDIVEQTPDTVDKVETESKTEEGNVDIQAESQHGGSEAAASVVEVKEDAKADNTEGPEELKKGSETEESKDADVNPTNGTKPGLESEDKDSDVNVKTDHLQNNTDDVIVVASYSQLQTSEPVVASDDNAAHQSDGEKEGFTAPDSLTDKASDKDANAADVDPPALNGDAKADTEEASKPSEEGASVVMKPQAESSQLTEKGPDHPEEDRGTDKDDNIREARAKMEASSLTPESLEIEDNRDLVKNWVNLHQTSKFFQTFVEPLDDYKGASLKATANEPNRNTRETESENAPEKMTSEGPAMTLKVSESKADDESIVENIEKETDHMTSHLNESEVHSKQEAIQSDLRSNHSKDDKDSESSPAKETLQVKEENEITDSTPVTETEHSGDKDAASSMKGEEHDGPNEKCEEDKPKDVTVEKDPEETDICKTEIESLTGVISLASGQPEDILENQNEEEADKGKSRTSPIPSVEEKMSASRDEPQEKVENQDNLSKSSLNDNAAKEPEDVKDAGEQKEGSTEVTEVTDLTLTSKDDDDDDDSRGESQSAQPQPVASEGSVSGNKNEEEWTEDSKHTVSKGQLSSLSVEGSTLYPRTSYPTLTNTQTESDK